MTEGEFSAIVEQAGALYGDALEFTSYDAEIDGNQARVTYTYEISGINQTQEPWSRNELGQWREDDC